MQTLNGNHVSGKVLIYSSLLINYVDLLQLFPVLNVS